MQKENKMYELLFLSNQMFLHNCESPIDIYYIGMQYSLEMELCVGSCFLKVEFEIKTHQHIGASK